MVQETAARILAAVHAFHTANPQRAGLAREELLPLADGHAELFDLAADVAWSPRSRSNTTAPCSRAAGWSARLSDRDQQLCGPDRRRNASGRLGRPALGRTGADRSRTGRARREDGAAAAERGMLVRLDERVFMHRDAVEAGKQVALRLFASRAVRFRRWNSATRSA